METRDSREVDAVRARKAHAETRYQAPVLGWPGHYTPVNSLAPFDSLITTSTGESSVDVTFGAPSFGVFEPMVRDVRGKSRDALDADTFYVTGADQIVRIHELKVPVASSDQRMFAFATWPTSPIRKDWSGEEIAVGQAERYSRLWAEPSKQIVHRSGIELAPGVESYARSVDALRDLSVIAELCLRHVPQARKVLLSVAHDPEDGTIGLRFLVWTSAAVEAVIDSEDSLHEELFERIPAARRFLFSIGYEFVR